MAAAPPSSMQPTTREHEDGVAFFFGPPGFQFHSFLLGRRCRFQKKNHSGFAWGGEKKEPAIYSTTAGLTSSCRIRTCRYSTYRRRNSAGVAFTQPPPRYGAAAAGSGGGKKTTAACALDEVGFFIRWMTRGQQPRRQRPTLVSVTKICSCAGLRFSAILYSARSRRMLGTSV